MSIPCFRSKNEQGTVAVIVRNEGLKMVEGPRGDGVWISNSKVIGKGERADRLVVAESPIDAMAFHQLKPPVEGEKRLYLGTAGNLSSGAPRYGAEAHRPVSAQTDRAGQRQ